MPYLVATLIYLSQNYFYYIRGDRSPLTLIEVVPTTTNTYSIDENIETSMIRVPADNMY